jgi:hypothetical protein
MNDIERYNFWHLEQDAFVKKQKEDKAVVEFAQRIGKPFENLQMIDTDKLFCEAIKRKGA